MRTGFFSSPGQSRGGDTVRDWSTLKQRLSNPQATRWGVASALTAAVALLLTAAGSAAPGAGPDRVLGWRVGLGNGEVTSFAELQETGAPRAIGIQISADALASLPSVPSDGHHCVDRDGDGVTAHAVECIHTHEFVIPLPDAVSRRADIPFKWALLNWNAHGHIPPGVYDVPHFDIHFYMAPIADIFAIRDGLCGPEFVDCDDFAVAKMPLPEGLMHPDFKDVDAVVPAMGNHFIDVSGPEFQGEPFTRTWIFGAYGGNVTFYEEMVSVAFLRSRPDVCSPIKSPPAVAVGGYYPTQRCVRYDSDANAYVVSMEEFVYREATGHTAH
jgi:hypothetical protein